MPASSPATTVFKCALHKHRTQCLVLGCLDMHHKAISRVGHPRGKASHRTKRLCVVDGCAKQAHARQKCVRHGGGKLCRMDECSQHARANGLCYRHRALASNTDGHLQTNHRCLGTPDSMELLLQDTMPLDDVVGHLDQSGNDLSTMVDDELWRLTPIPFAPETPDELLRRLVHSVACLNQMQALSPWLHP
ncbi:Aste57867_10213 [Aphanomyces stellatus]|uniref:Aste57867_10213 protein n=1 Tax=Aphanomyces stellatus TaxID=120398 RepID=A0A485KQB2_9STRA|nr:hypothetical protein As57867_010174 [Aphanomyces stellatus]VFT87089.1 Aste57867_10213 [Aphanomyces stellatus]